MTKVERKKIHQHLVEKKTFVLFVPRAELNIFAFVIVAVAVAVAVVVVVVRSLHFKQTTLLIVSHPIRGNDDAGTDDGDSDDADD